MCIKQLRRCANKQDSTNVFDFYDVKQASNKRKELEGDESAGSSVAIHIVNCKHTFAMLVGVLLC
jgi:hypothetical protein